MKLKTLVTLCFLSFSLSLLFLLMAVFVLHDILQSSILLFFVLSTGTSLILIKTKGWLKLPAVITIACGYILMTALYLLSEQQIMTIAIWYLLYLLFTSYFLGLKDLIYLFIFTSLIIFYKVYLVNQNFFIIPIIHPESSIKPYYEAIQVLIFLLILGVIIGVITNNSRKGQIETENLLNNREILMKEIHHRVKNNLQIIYSLLELQKNKYDEESHLDILNTASGRITSMALIHEMLYESNNLGSIDISDYTNRLCTTLAESSGGDLKITNTSEQISSFNPDIVIPYGLILNELITNSIKHAKGKDKKANISIEQAENNKVKISYSDNGELPLDQNLFNRKHSSLGLKIITSLIKQIRGTITQIPSEKGFNIVMEIPSVSKKLN